MESSTRRERKKEETRGKILDAAFKLFVGNGFENTTIDQITGEADIGKGTFYNYFPCKESVLHELMESIGRERGEKIWPSIVEVDDTRKRLVKVFDSLASWFQEYPELARAYLEDKTIRDIKNRTEHRLNHLERFLVDILKMGQENGDIRDDIEPTQLVYYLDAILLIQLNLWFWNEAQDNLLQLIMHGVDFFLIGALSTENDMGSGGI